MKLRCASWEAVSSKPQVEKVSLADQRTANQRKIAELGGDCVVVLSVPGQSRDIVLFEEACATIEAYAQLRDLVITGKIDLLVYYTKSRLGRTIALCETVVAFCWQHDVAVYDLSAPPSTLNAQEQRKSAGDTLTGAVMSWRSQNEISEIQQRNKSGMIGRIKRGKFAARQPWGLRKVYAPDGSWQIVVDEDKAPAIRKAFDLYLQGLGTRDLAKRMNEQGYTVGDGGPWTSGAVQYIVKAVRLYAGYTEVNRRSPSGRPHTVAKGNHPAIISEDTMQRVIDEQRSRAAARRAVGSPYLFSRLVTCGVCQRLMHVSGYGSRRMYSTIGKRYTYPVCRCGRCHRQCTFKSVRAALDAWIEHISQMGIAEIDDSTGGAELEKQIAQLEKQLADNDRARERANTAYTDGVMDYDAYKAQLKRLDTKRVQITDDLRQTQQAATHKRQREEAIEQLANITEIYGAMMDLPDVVAVNAWLRSFLRITFEADRSITVALL